MSLNFPDAPANGQTFDNWMWDGQKWVVVGTPTGFLPLTGGTINGNLTVLGATTLNGTTATTPNLNDYSNNVATTSWVKQQNYINIHTPISLIGDVTASGEIGNPLITTLVTTGVTPGTYQGITVDAKGRVISAALINYVTDVDVVAGDMTGSGVINSSTGAVTIPVVLNTVNANVGTFNGITVNGKGLVTAAVDRAYLTDNQLITLSGDVTGNGTTMITAVLPAVNSAVGTFNGITVNAKGQVTNASNMGYLTAAPTVTLTGDVTGSGAASIATSVVKLHGFSVSATAPSDTYVLTWNNAGSYWYPAPIPPPAAAPAPITISDIMPTTSSQGDAWWDSASGNLFIRYDDGSSAQWIIAVTAAGVLPPANNYDVLVYSSGAWGNQRPKYAVGFSFVGGVLPASQVLGLHMFSKAITFGANFANYLGHASEAGGTATATGSTVITISRALAASPTTFATVGTVTFAAGTVTPTFATTGGAAVAFAVGDSLRLIAPVTPDTTFANFYATLVGYET